MVSLVTACPNLAIVDSYFWLLVSSEMISLQITYLIFGYPVSLEMAILFSSVLAASRKGLEKKMFRCIHELTRFLLRFRCGRVPVAS